MKNIIKVGLVILLLGNSLFFSCKKDPFINTPPVIADQQFSINENSPNGTVVGNVIASDVDKDQILKYYIISGNFNDAFKIDSLTGAISVNNSSVLDYEKTTKFELGVRVKDNYVEILSSSSNVTISITNIPDVIISKNGLIAYYPFNGNANDESGNSYNGIVHGTTLTQGRNNELYGAYLFDGTSNYIELPSSVALNSSNDFSIEACINNAGVTADARYSDDAIYGQSDGASGTDYPFIALEVKSDMTIRGVIRGTNNPPLDIRSQNIIDVNKWYHVVMTKNSNYLSLYIDGELVSKNYTVLVGNTTTNDFVAIGAYFDDLLGIYHFYHGKIDMVRLWSISLTQPQIEALHTDNYVIQ